MERPFMFLGRLGPGEVIGRSWDESETLRLAMLDRVPPKDLVDAKPGPGSGARLTGESGDEDGDGSERSDESVHDTVVVGDESADSVVRVDVLSWCLWPGSGGRAPGPSASCEAFGSLAPSMRMEGSMMVTALDWSIEPPSTS